LLPLLTLLVLPPPLPLLLLTSRLSTSPNDSPDAFSALLTLPAAAFPALTPFMFMIGAVLMLSTIS